MKVFESYGISTTISIIVLNMQIKEIMIYDKKLLILQ